MTDEPPPGYVAIGRVLGAWGVRGHVRVEVLASRRVLAPGRKVKIAEREDQIERVGGTGRTLHIKLAGLHVREEAAGLRGQYLLVPESDLEPLPEGEFYRFQLIGLRVITTDGRQLGEITDLISTPENDVFVVRGEMGETLIPVIEDIVVDIDVPAGMVTIEAVPGLLKE